MVFGVVISIGGIMPSSSHMASHSIQKAYIKCLEEAALL